jgi:hypothetical protein
VSAFLIVYIAISALDGFSVLALAVKAKRQFGTADLLGWCLKGGLMAWAVCLLVMR